ncbi:MAG: hypothetical protein WAU68_17410 [Vitreimonas sp.]
MADTSPPQTLSDLYAHATAPWDRYLDFAAGRGHPTTITEMILAALSAVNSSLEIISENTGDSTELREKIASKWASLADGPAIQATFFRQAIRRLNAGNWIAIGYRVYASGRREPNYVWPGRFSARDFDWMHGTYFDGLIRYEDIRIIASDRCTAELLQKFARKRAGKIGRPEIAEIRIAIQRAANRVPDFWEPSSHKEAVWEAQRELACLKSGDKLALEEITDDMLESESAIDKAIRAQRRELDQFS